MTDKIAELRNEIARSIRSVRLVCFGRKCLKDCARRMAAAAPHPRATMRRWGAAVAAVLVCLGAYAQEVSTVRCIWDDSVQQYRCSGTGGSIIEVQGGGVIIQTVTNFLGGCTNCVNMTPQQCAATKSAILSTCDDISYQGVAGHTEDLRMAAFEARQIILDQQEDISTFRRFGFQTSTSVLSLWPSFTNYIYGTENSQTRLVRSFDGNNSANGRVQRVAYNDGIYDYANNVVSPTLASNLSSLLEVVRISQVIDDKVLSLRSTVDSNLNCDSCPGSDSDGDCGDCTSGNWCTVEQGDAIIELLDDTKDYVEKLKSAVVAISNNVAVAVQTLHEGFFTSYTHIPTEEELGHTWQELYLEGYSPNFHEYAATNILARIELLLAGMSGVLTNSSAFAEAGDFADTGMARTNEFDYIAEDFTNRVADVLDEREQNVRSVGDALIGLYDAFRGWSGTPFSLTTLVNSYSVEIGENHYDVPGFEPSEKGLYVANLIRLVCRSVMSVIWILFTVSVFIRFHIAFFQWVYKYLKWGIELMQGLFA